MLLHIVKKEIYENLLSLRFAIAVVLCFLVVTASIVILGKGYVDDEYDYVREVKGNEDYVKGADHPWIFIYRGVPVAKPPAKLAVFNQGVGDAGRSARVYAYREPAFFSRGGKNPVSFLFPAMDLLFFVSVVMSLLALVFSYDAVSGEKFNETLKLLVSYPVRRSTIILGKWIGGYLSLLAPFILSTAAGILVLYVWVPDVRFSGEELLRLGGLAALACVYLSVVYTFGILVSANTARPSTSITLLLLVWVAVVLVVPNISPSVASLFVKTENVQTVEQKKRKVMEEARAAYRKKMRQYWRDEALRKKVPSGVYRRTAQKERCREVRRGLEKINRDYTRKMEAQVRLAKWISRISPLASFTYAAGVLTGTGYEEEYAFREAVEDYARTVMDFSFDAWIAMDKAAAAGRGRIPFDTGHVPRFSYGAFRRKMFSREAADLCLDVGLLLCWNLVGFLAAYVSFMRYDVK